MSRDNIQTVTNSDESATDQDFKSVTGTDVDLGAGLVKRTLDVFVRGFTFAVGFLMPTQEVPIETFATSVESSITAASGFTISAVTDQKLLIVQLHVSGIWYWGTDTGTVPTGLNAVRFGSVDKLVLNNMNTDIIIAPLSITGDVTIIKGSP